jgi:uncharacterized protein
MPVQLPRLIDPNQLTDRGVTLAGELPFAEMRRLSALGLHGDPLITVELAFSKSSQGLMMASGSAGTALELTCQRCLQPLMVRLEIGLNWEFVASAAAAGELGGEFEPVSIEQCPLNFCELIEDDILLALPIAPAHRSGECVTAGVGDEGVGARPKPFGVLAELRDRGR